MWGRLGALWALGMDVAHGCLLALIYVKAYIGSSVGQTVFHCHIDLISSRNGDVENPRGGVRHVLRGEGFFEERK